MKSSGKTDFFPHGVVVNRQAGKGIKVGDVDDYDWCWRDITAPITTRGIGVNDPDWVQIGATAFYAYKFSLNDESYLDFHWPHDYVPGTPFHIHAHWLAATGNDTTNTVKWQFEMAFALGFGQQAFALGSPVTYTAEEPSAGQYYHMVTETTAIADFDITEPDGFLKAVVTRVTNGATNNTTDDIFLFAVDVHYQSHSLGTAGKNPSPGFYAQQS